MATIKLYTYDGRFVTEATTPPWKIQPELYVWGERYFLLRADGRYTEARGSFWLAPVVAPETLSESPWESNSPQGHPRATTDGEPPTEELWGSGAPKPINPETGQHGAYFILPEEERKKGFTRPYREAYIHMTCGAVTRMDRKIAETYARDPSYYGRTFCVSCKEHLPVGAEGEFVWDEPIFRTDPNDWTGFSKVGT